MTNIMLSALVFGLGYVTALYKLSLLLLLLLLLSTTSLVVRMPVEDGPDGGGR